jgi:DNA-binding XRE family transcriptional regulator
MAIIPKSFVRFFIKPPFNSNRYGWASFTAPKGSYPPQDGRQTARNSLFKAIQLFNLNPIYYIGISSYQIYWVVINTFGWDKDVFTIYQGVYMTNIRELLGSNIKTYRNNLGISQEKLAEMINMATNYLGLIEGGKKFPSADMIERIAAALGKDTPDLFTVTPIRQNWKERILLKIDAVIEEEIKSCS